MSAERTDPTTSTPFAARMSVEQIEEGSLWHLSSMPVD